METVLLLGKSWLVLAGGVVTLFILLYAFTTHRTWASSRIISPEMARLKVMASRSCLVRTNGTRDWFTLENVDLLIRCNYTDYTEGLYVGTIVVLYKQEAAYWIFSMAGDECQQITLVHAAYRKTRLLALDLRSRYPAAADALSELTHQWGLLGRTE